MYGNMQTGSEPVICTKPHITCAMLALNPIALRKAKIVCNFGLSECNEIGLVSKKLMTKFTYAKLKNILCLRL